MLCGKCMLICPRGVETRKMILEMLNYIKTKLKSWNHYYAAIRIHEQNILRSLCPAVHDRSGRATGVLCVRYYKWIKSFPKEERKKIRKGLFSFKTIRSGWEIFRESLLHHNIFKTNPMLGYMHMTFAFGWFLLIVVGKIDHTSAFNPPYFAIFFRYFHPAKETFPYSEFFAFLMDLILTFLLIGILLAITKRFCSRIFGMKKTTKNGLTICLY